MLVNTYIPDRGCSMPTLGFAFEIFPHGNYDVANRETRTKAEA
jgi:hypothetical protein